MNNNRAMAFICLALLFLHYVYNILWNWGGKCSSCVSLRYDMVLDAVRLHHEKYNGQGYPLGLAGEEIPILARIIQICDVYDALTSDRPYRKGYSSEEAVQIMKETPDHFDPVLFQDFINRIQ